MAIYKPKRLYRKTASIPKPLFALLEPNIGTVNDSEIRSVTINRGKNDNSGGVNPSTMEIELANNRVGKAGNTVELLINLGARNAIAAKIGGGTAEASYIARRFSGRLGRQQMEDTGKIPTNTLFGSSWSAQLSYSPDVHSVPSGTSMLTLLERILEPSYLASRITVTSQGTFDSTFGDSTGKYSDLIGDYAADIGILVRDLRAGGLEILPMPYRRDTALAAIPTSVPLTRAQALSPATWTQPNETPAVEYRLKYRDAANVVKTIVTSGTGAVTGTAPVEDLDWTYFRSYTDQWRYVQGLRSSGFDDRFRLEQVTVDILELLDSPYPYHWQQAGYMLKMEVGAPVFLGGDWPTVLRGVHFAEGMTEKITPESWEITLNLIRFRELTGDEPVGTIPARVWDQATYPWNTETKNWNQI